jgi:hypothetical protein
MSCCVCTHPDRKAIDEALEARTPYSALMVQYGLRSRDLKKHNDNHTRIGQLNAAARAPRTKPRGRHGRNSGWR